ncbi:MAG: hypothetical protein NTY19_05920 [Planctomycetota bacterium]|nr:hypothetical protein [Planctomycetota bacterium]
MTVQDLAKVDLRLFTFQSLYFCAVPVGQLSGERFRICVNEWYMPLIRAGWAVPLSFVLDLGTLLQRPATALRSRWKENVRDDIKQLAFRYHQMLAGLRRQPHFATIADRLSRTPQQTQRDQATQLFLRFLLAELSHFRNTFAFDSRDLRLLAARPAADGIRDVVLQSRGKTHQGTMLFGDPGRFEGRNEFGTIYDLLSSITDYYRTHLLHTFISPEQLLLVELTARTPAQAGRLDYRFLHELLGRGELEDVEEQEPRPPRVDRILPTDSYEVDGQVGGYIDVNRRRFSGSLAEILPMELSLVKHPPLMYQRLLNEGALHFVREDVECIEREVRLLFCFVVDVNERMLAPPTDVHPSFGKGMTPYIRARTLASLLLMDLAQHLPREDVHADCAVFLWSSQARHTYRTEFDLFEALSPATARQRYTFAAAFAERVPYMFVHRVSQTADKEGLALDRDPCQYLVRRSQTRVYHCRHMFFFTSGHSMRHAIPDTDPGLQTWEGARDSLFAVCCDVHQPTLGVARPRHPRDAVDAARRGDLGLMNEERLRAKIVETVLLKAADRVARLDDTALSDLS